MFKKKLSLFLIFLFISSLLSATATYTIKLIDSYGDGWNGASVDVLVNGNVVLDDITVENTSVHNDGYWVEYTFDVVTDDEITTTFASGSYNSECTYRIFDWDSVEVGSDGPSPSGISTPIIATEPAGNFPVIATNPVPLTDSIIDGTTLSELTWDFGQYTESYDLYLDVVNPPTIKVVDNAVPNGTGSFPLTNLLTGTTYYWKVVSRNSGGTRYEADGDVWNFTTDINAVAPNTLIGFEEGVISNALIETNDNTITASQNQANTGSYALEFASNSYAYGEDGSVTYKFQENQNAILNFWYMLDYSSYYSDLSVDFRLASSETWVEVWTNESTTYDTWLNTVVDLSEHETSSSSFFIRFNGHSYNGGSYSDYKTWVDDIQVIELTGNVPVVADNPIPQNSAMDVAIDLNELTWDFGDFTETYDLYLDTVNPPVTKVVDNATATTTGSYTLPNLEYTSTYYWKIVSRNSDGTRYEVESDVWSFSTELDPNIIQIGEGSETGKEIPIEFFYGYTYSQTIYLADEFNISELKKIDKIYYHYNGYSAHTNDLKLYYSLTDAVQFDSTADWKPLEELTEIFDGTINFPNTEGWVEIHLDNPFYFNGNQNLVIGVEENTSGYNSSSDEFYCTSTTQDRSLIYRNDSNNPDPSSPPAGILKSYIPNTRFYLGAPPENELAVTNVSYDDNLYHEQQIVNFNVEIANFSIANPMNETLNLKVNNTIVNSELFSIQSGEISTIVIPWTIEDLRTDDVTVEVELDYVDSNLDNNSYTLPFSYYGRFELAESFENTIPPVGWSFEGNAQASTDTPFYGEKSLELDDTSIVFTPEVHTYANDELIFWTNDPANIIVGFDDITRETLAFTQNEVENGYTRCVVTFANERYGKIKFQANSTLKLDNILGIMFNVPVEPTFVSNPTNLKVADERVGLIGENYQITISNIGQNTLTINDITLEDGTHFTVENLPNLPIDLDYQEITTLNVHFNPSDLAIADSITYFDNILVNTGAREVNSINLEGKAWPEVGNEISNPRQIQFVSDLFYTHYNNLGVYGNNVTYDNLNGSDFVYQFDLTDTRQLAFQLDENNFAGDLLLFQATDMTNPILRGINEITDVSLIAGSYILVVEGEIEGSLYRLNVILDSAENYNFALLEEETEKSGEQNSIVEYNFSIVNLGAQADDYQIAINSEWNAVVTRNSRYLVNYGEIAEFTCSVTIPEEISFNTQNTTELTVSSQNSDQVEVLNLTTRCELIDIQEENNIFADAFELDSSINIYNANIAPVNDVDWYKIFLEEGTAYTVFSTRPEGSEIDTKVHVFMEENYIASDDDSNSNVQFRYSGVASADAYYYFRVAYYNNSSYDDELPVVRQKIGSRATTGEYDFNIELGVNPEVTTSVANFNYGERANSDVLIDTLLITNTGVQDLIINSIQIGDIFTLLDDFSGSFISRNDTISVRFALNLNVDPGEYSEEIVITANHAEETTIIPVNITLVNYEDPYEENNDQENATLITYSETPYSASIFPSTDIDYYKFSATENDQVQVKVDLAENESEFDVMFTLSYLEAPARVVDIYEVVVNNNADGGDEIIVENLPNTGEYLIKVERTNIRTRSTLSSAYDLNLQLVNFPVIVADNDILDFGSFGVYDTSITLPLVVENIGSGSLNIVSWEIVGENAAEFTIADFVNPIPLGSTSLEVSTNHQLPGMKNAELQITLDNQEILNIGLEAYVYLGVSPLFDENFNQWNEIQFTQSTEDTKDWLSYSGAARANFWSWSSGNNATLVSNEIMINNSANFSFDWSHSYNTSYPNDQLIVSYSDDQGITWNELFNKSGSELESNDGASSTSPGSYTNFETQINVNGEQSIQLKFDAISGWGPDVFIDNIYVSTFNVMFDSAYNPMEIIFNSVSTEFINTTVDDIVYIYDNDLMLSYFDPINVQNVFVPADNPETTEIDGFLNGNPITLKYWSHDLQEMITLAEINPEEILFIENGNINIDVTFIGRATQNINLLEGWNYVSFNTEYGMPNLFDRFLPVFDNIDQIVDENLNTIEELPFIGIVDNIGSWSLEEGYRVKANNASDFFITDVPASLPMNIQLHAGTNLIGFPAQEPANALTTVNDSLKGVFAELAESGNLDLVVSETGDALFFIPELGWINNIGIIEPGKAYFVIVVEDDILQIKADYEIPAPLPGIIATRNSHYQNPYNGNPYSSMQIFATLNELELNSDDEISVYDGDLCVGFAKQNENNSYLLIRAFKDDPTTEEVDGYTIGNPMSFRRWNSSNNEEEVLSNIVINDVLTFQDLTISQMELSTFTAVNPNQVPKVTALKGNYPNPFNPTTSISFSLSKNSLVNLEVYNVKGQKVKTLINDELEATNHLVEWNGESDNGNPVASGVYFYRLKTDSYSKTKKMMLLK